MIVKTAFDGDRELRLFELEGTIVPRPSEGQLSVGGTMRTPALQIAAVACAVRLVAEEIASFVMRVYEGDAQQRTQVLDAPQARLFQDPGEGWTSFDVWSDVITAIELEKHAFLWKLRTKNHGLQEIYPLDPGFFRVRRAKGTNKKIVEAWIEGKVKDVTADVIHIRGWSPNAGPEGIASSDLHRRLLKTAVDFDDYRGAYFQNDGMPGIVLEHPGKPTRDQRRDIIEAWSKRHTKPRNAGRIGMTWDGMKVTPLNSNLRDSQAVEVADNIVRDVARAWRIYPSELLHVSIQGTRPPASAEVWSDLFFRFTLLPRLRRVERAIAADRDVFPDIKRYSRFDVSEFVRGDVATTANVIHMLAQVGVLTKNEGRAILGLPPIDGGDVLLEVPVGGGGGSIGPDAGTTDEPDDEPDVQPT
jgi:HK97 family phage portal protein